MSDKVDLKLDWCSYEAAKYAVEHWHYSKRMPRSKLVTIGVWEYSKFIGAIIFGYGATPQIGSPYGLKQTEVIELVRVALTNHITNVSRMLSIAAKMIKGQSSGIRLIVSFADSAEGHHGGIYQASGWLYSGETGNGDRVGFIVNGEKMHTRTVGHTPNGVQSLKWVQENIDNDAIEWIGKSKHRYLYPLDEAMRQQIEPLRKPYPKRERSIDSDAAGVQPADGGASPTRSLLNELV